MRSTRPAYKQEEGVAYHARDMAVVRARQEACAIVLASATPSIETRENARQGRYGWLRLESRFAGRSLPTMEAVDLRRDAPPRGKWISPRLAEALRDNFARHEQALLFLNRRGYAPLTLCRRAATGFNVPIARPGWSSIATAAPSSAIIAAMSSAGPTNARNATRRIR